MAATPYELSYKGFIDTDFINIRLDGVLYENIPKVTDEEHGQNLYGDALGELQFELISHTDGTNYFNRRDNVYSGHTIEVLSVVGKSEVNVDECFKKAVESVAGFSCKGTMTLITEESVTTSSGFMGIVSGEFVYPRLIDANTIKVTFNGAEYECTRSVIDEAYSYGGTGQEGPDFSEYPFCIQSFVDSFNVTVVHNMLLTESAGTYQVKIEALNSVATTSPCFETAVHSVVDEDIESLKPMIISSRTMVVGGGTIDAKFADIYDTFYGGKRVVVRNTNAGNAFEVVGVAKNSNGGGTVISSDGHTYTASSDDAYPSYSSGSGGDDSAA